MNAIKKNSRLCLYLLFYILLINIQPITCQNKIAAFGSSVCSGTGDELNAGGYIGRLKLILAKYNWNVINVSRGGDNTIKIQDRWQKGENPSLRSVGDDQYLLPQKPDYVIIGLSLANEGILKNSKAGRDSVYEQFRVGLLGIINRCFKEGYKVVVANCYPNSEFKTEQYSAVKKMNMLISNLDIPSINLLGTIDNGYGGWVEGFYRDPWHPSSGGHREMSFAAVPTLFDALAQGKPAPHFVRSNKFLKVNNVKGAALEFIPADTIHAFSVSCKIRKPIDITALKISGKKGILIVTQFEYEKQKRNNISVVPSRDTVNALIKFEKGKIIYISSEGTYLEKGIDLDSARWYTVTMSHMTSRGETKIYVGGEMIFKTDERIIPGKIESGLNGASDLTDLLVYRSSLNSDEIKACSEGNLIQSSLEVYSPLDDEVFSPGENVKNRAQSLSGFVYKGKKIP